MSLEDFQLKDKEITDKNSIIKTDFLKLHHQQAANLNGSDQNIEFIFGDKKIYLQIGNVYLQNDIKAEKAIAVAAKRVVVDGDVFRLVKKRFCIMF